MEDGEEGPPGASPLLLLALVSLPEILHLSSACSTWVEVSLPSSLLKKALGVRNVLPPELRGAQSGDQAARPPDLGLPGIKAQLGP